MMFHTDENVSGAVALGLKRRGFDVSATPRAGLLGVSDEEQLAFRRREGRVLMTHDADMLRLAAIDTSHAGIATVKIIATSLANLYCGRSHWPVGFRPQK